MIKEKIMFDNKSFYPTPDNLISKMWDKIEAKGNIKNILEPSAGKGDICDYINDSVRYNHRRYQFSCIESDENLRSILIGKKLKVIDSDFLEYAGYDNFDLIIANPPFHEGEKHLLKAIDIMHSGQIVFLLNAETLKNPYTNTRLLLQEKLTKLKASVEFINDAFMQAERKTTAQVAIIHINIGNGENKPNFFEDSTDTLKEREIDVEPEEEKNIAPRNTIEFLVAEYEDRIQTAFRVLEHFYKNSGKIRGLICIDNVSNRDRYSASSPSELINTFLKEIRIEYWKKILELKDVKSRMTEKKIIEFNEAIDIQADMEFTEKNIRAFILQLIGNYENILKGAVLEVFDTMSHKHHYDETSGNIHYFNGWKTNKSYFVNKKVILPARNSYYTNPFYEFGGGLRLDGRTARFLNDIDIVMNYFTGDKDYISISEAIDTAFSMGKTSGIQSSYFKIACYKKGTVHLTFLDENVRRRFNIEACKGKNWLPKGYGTKTYANMTPEEKETVHNFEGVRSYNKHINQVGFVNKNMAHINLH